MRPDIQLRSRTSGHLIQAVSPYLGSVYVLLCIRKHSRGQPNQGLTPTSSMSCLHSRLTLLIENGNILRILILFIINAM